MNRWIRKIADLRKAKMFGSDGPRTKKSGPGGIRTPGHGIKSPALYLAKLLALSRRYKYHPYKFLQWFNYFHPFLIAKNSAFCYCVLTIIIQLSTVIKPVLENVIYI